jgi:hypothetical protein
MTAFNVGELKEMLKNIPDDTEIFCIGGDHEAFSTVVHDWFVVDEGHCHFAQYYEEDDDEDFVNMYGTKAKKIRALVIGDC